MQPKMMCCRTSSFAAAHFLPNHLGKCKNLHGHTWKLEVCLQGRVHEDGMVLDFGLIKDIINDNILTILDHSNLNDTLPNPTAENLIKWIWVLLTKSEVTPYRLRLWESDNSYVEYRGPQGGLINA